MKAQPFFFSFVCLLEFTRYTVFVCFLLVATTSFVNVLTMPVFFLLRKQSAVTPFLPALFDLDSQAVHQLFLIFFFSC